MNTLFDFISNVNGLQYAIALLSIAGFIVFQEILKPKPFAGLAKAVAEDVRFMRERGKGPIIQLLKCAVMAPVYGAIYLVSVPVLFAQGVAGSVGRGIATVTSGGWSPVRAYFTGRRKAKKADKAGKADADGKSGEGN